LAVLALATLAWSPAHADLASALQAVKSQPRAVDAEADTSGNIYVLVRPEKIAWNQYAAAMCGVIKPHQARVFRVRVIEVTKASRGKPQGSWERLGEADCGR
jgi:hypothetical protein